MYKTQHPLSTLTLTDKVQTPVEVLNEAIGDVKAAIGDIQAKSIEDVLMVQFLAALELAKADAELKRHFPELGMTKCAQCRAAFERLEATRTKLYEALQR